MKEMLKTDYYFQIENSLDHLIKYLRYQEKQFRDFKSDISGQELLMTLLKEGIVRQDLFIYLLILIENLDHPYEFKIS